MENQTFENAFLNVPLSEKGLYTYFITFLMTFGPPSAFLSSVIQPACMALLKPTLAFGIVAYSKMTTLDDILPAQSVIRSYK